MSCTSSRSGAAGVVDGGRRDSVGSAIGNAATGNIWALLSDLDHERRGDGRLLHTAMVERPVGAGLDMLWLTTATAHERSAFTRHRAGGDCDTSSGEFVFELRRAQTPFDV